MAINLNLTALDDGGASIPYIAPLRLSAGTPTTLNGGATASVPTWNNTTVSSGIHGARSVFATTIDASSYEYLTWLMTSVRYNFPNDGVTSYATGGIIVVFEDSSGNYAGWSVYGDGITGYAANDRDSYFTSYSGSAHFLVKRTETPDFSSGAIDWSDLVAAEFYADVTVSNGSLGFGFLKGLNQMQVTGTGETFSSISSEYNSNFSIFHFDEARPLYSGSAQKQYSVRHGFDIGDGTTATTITDSNVYLGLTNPQVFQADGFVTTGFLLKQPDNRLIKTKANATLTLSGFTISSAGQFEVINEGTTVFSDGAVIRANSVDARGSATYESIILSKCQEFKIDGTTAITNVAYNGQPSTGLGVVVTSSAGDYSGVAVLFNNNLGKDISLGAGGAGTYDLSGVTVASGYTLKVHNNSPTNAIVVTIPNGVTTSTTTAGGPITIQNPNVNFQISRPNILDGANFVFENTTQATEPANGTTSGGTGIDVTLVKGTDYDAGDNIRMRIGYTSGVTAKSPIEENFTGPTSPAINDAPTAMVDYTVYNTISIDGSTKTGIFVADYVDDEIDITLAADFLGQDFMAWWVYNEATLDGLRKFFGVYTLEDVANMRNNSGILPVMFDNTTTTNIKQIDNVRIYRADLAYPVREPSSGGGCIDIVWREKVLVTTVQISGADVSDIADAVWAKTI